MANTVIRCGCRMVRGDDGSGAARREIGTACVDGRTRRAAPLPDDMGRRALGKLLRGAARGCA